MLAFTSFHPVQLRFQPFNNVAFALDKGQRAFIIGAINNNTLNSQGVIHADNHIIHDTCGFIFCVHAFLQLPCGLIYRQSAGVKSWADSITPQEGSERQSSLGLGKLHLGDSLPHEGKAEGVHLTGPSMGDYTARYRQRYHPVHRGGLPAYPNFQVTNRPFRRCAIAIPRLYWHQVETPHSSGCVIRSKKE
jgi:hypothetical protein